MQFFHWFADPCLMFPPQEGLKISGLKSADERRLSSS